MTLKSVLTAIMLFTIAGMVSSCGGKKSVQESLPPPSMQYTIGPEDVLKIDVWREPQLSLSVPVRSDGKISLPLINDVYVAGLTPLELKDELTRRLSQFIENPTVSVIAQEIKSLKIFVTGEVKTPGVYELDREINIVQAISLAGGFTEWANKRKIKILRKHKGAETTFTVNYNKIISGKHPDLNIPLQPGDTIVVP